MLGNAIFYLHVCARCSDLLVSIERHGQYKRCAMLVILCGMLEAKEKTNNEEKEKRKNYIVNKSCN